MGLVVAPIALKQLSEDRGGTSSCPGPFQRTESNSVSSCGECGGGALRTVGVVLCTGVHNNGKKTNKYNMSMYICTNLESSYIQLIYKSTLVSLSVNM